MKSLKMLDASDITFESIYAQLNTIEKQLKGIDVSQESLQGFVDKILIPLADIAASIGMINKTNVLSVLNGFSRSEIRDYTDTRIATLNRVENSKLLQLKDTEIYIPAGMTSTFFDAVQVLEKVYVELDISNTVTRMTMRVKGIEQALRSATSAEEFEKLSELKEVSTIFAAINKQILSAQKLQSTVFSEKQGEPLRVPFSKGYSSVVELKKTRLLLLDMEGQYLELAKFENVPNKLSKRYSNIGKFIKVSGFNLTKAHLQTIFETTKTCAKFFEAIAGVLNMHMKLDHNMVLNYTTFEKVVME